MGLHDGHRQRAKDRYRQLGADALADHELLELALFYAIPRQDTNETAHRLLKRFRSLQGVLQATPEELEKEEGVGRSAALLLCLLLAKPIGAYQFGEHYAASMGVNVRRFRAALIGLSCLLAACVTALVGPISFVGIAVPHITRLSLKTTKPVVTIPAIFLCGAVFCMFCDLIARMAFAPTELNISTVTSVFGAPIVIFMMLRRKRGN